MRRLYQLIEDGSNGSYGSRHTPMCSTRSLACTIVVMGLCLLGLGAGWSGTLLIWY